MVENYVCVEEAYSYFCWNGLMFVHLSLKYISYLKIPSCWKFDLLEKYVNQSYNITAWLPSFYMPKLRGVFSFEINLRKPLPQSFMLVSIAWGKMLTERENWNKCILSWRLPNWYRSISYLAVSYLFFGKFSWVLIYWTKGFQQNCFFRSSVNGTYTSISKPFMKTQHLYWNALECQGELSCLTCIHASEINVGVFKVLWFYSFKLLLWLWNL